MRLRQLPLSALVVPACALLLFLGHVPLVAHSLEDIDSVNFALALHEFDVRKHQPHPPGYPVVVALGRVSERALAVSGVPDGPSRDAMALSVNGVIAGSFALLPLVTVFRRLNRLRGESGGVADSWRPVLAAALVVCSPLYWFTMIRPLSDLVGLLFVLSAQALLLTAWLGARWPSGTGVSTSVADRCLVVGSAAAALAIGCRSQAAWLVLPLWCIALVSRRGDGAARRQGLAALVFAAVLLAWMVPMIAASGGPTGYFTALAEQANADFNGVDMVSTSRSMRFFAYALRFTFVDPWATLSLAAPILLAAGIGFVAVARRSRRAVLALSLLTLPYLVFHLLFQETMTSRYDLPLVPVIAWLAVEGVAVLGTLGAPVLVAAAAAAGLTLAVPASVLYARDGSPTMRAVAAVTEQEHAGRHAMVVVHYGLSRAVRADATVRPTWAPDVGHEWLAAAEYWRHGGADPVWFLAENRRSDLALVDPRSRILRGDYEWGFDSRRFMRGVRPSAVSWVEVVSPPGWFLGEGWGLTPETAGLSLRDHVGLPYGSIQGFVRRRPDPATLLIGGWHLGAAGSAPARVEVAIDGALVDAWTAEPGPFLRTVRLPAGRLAGTNYATLDVRASSVHGEPGGPVAIEQFDLQSAGVPVVGYADGWYHTEFKRDGRVFRWAAPRADLRVLADRDVTVTIAGDVPIKDLKEPPHVIVRAGRETLLDETPAGPFRWSFRVAAGTLSAAGGLMRIESDRTFVPSGRGRRGDDRTLALRVFGVEITPAR